jgi:hypothetical protein
LVEYSSILLDKKNVTASKAGQHNAKTQAPTGNKIIMILG